MPEVVLTLPDDLAKEAKELGLFKPLLVASLFKEEIRRRKANQLFATAERLAQSGETMSEEQVMEEVRAVRKERRSKLK